MRDPSDRIIDTLLIANAQDNGELLRQAFAGSPQLRVRDVMETGKASASLTERTQAQGLAKPDLLLVEASGSSAGGCSTVADLLGRIKTHPELPGFL